MARRYDQSTTTFSPEGRLHQVEYAIEAINNAGTCVGLKSTDGVVLAAEKRVVSKLLAPSKTSEKTYTIDDHAACLVAGLNADANILIQEARVRSQRYLYEYQEPIPVENMVKAVCNYKQAYTQFGGLRYVKLYLNPILTHTTLIINQSLIIMYSLWIHPILPFL